MLRSPIACAVLLLLAFTATARSAADGTKILYRLAGANGVAATSEEVKATIGVLRSRLTVVGLAGIEVAPTTTVSEITLTLPDALVGKLDRIRTVTERPGTVAFKDQHGGEPLAVILDGEVNFAPILRSALDAGVIEGAGQGLSEQEARDVAARLGCGALPVRLFRIQAAGSK